VPSKALRFGEDSSAWWLAVATGADCEDRVKPDAATSINEPGSGSDARYKVGTFSGPGVMRRDAMRLPL